MKISAINNVSFNGDKKISQKAKAATVATLLIITPAGYSTENDTFERNENPVTTELVATPQSVSQIKTTQTEGNKFGRWFWDMVDCINDDDKFDTNIMKEKGYNYYYPEVTNYDNLAESIVKSMDKNGDNEVSQKEFFNKSIEILEQQGQDYSYEEEQNMKNIVLTPLFRGLDYIGSATDRTNGTNTLNKKEIAGNLYALSKKNLKTGRFSGSAVAEEFISIMTEGHPTGQFKTNRASYK